jgi:predicted metal-dependent peptidase
MKRMQGARTRLLLDQPFFGVLALNLTLVEDPTIPYLAWTDGRILGYNPSLIDTIDNDELVGLIAHEVMHCALGHPWRRENRQPDKWNYAADYAVNSILDEAKFKLPQGGLLDPQYKGKWSEWIYDRLPDSQGQGSDGRRGWGSGWGEVRDAPSDAAPDGTPAPTEADWQQNVRQAIKSAAGKLPASLKRELDTAMAPKVDWRSLLRRYIQDAAKADYSWTRPSPRYSAMGLYLPIMRSEAMGRIVIAVDTSGSIDGVLLSQFAAEMRSIVEDMQPSTTDVMYCDAKVHRVDSFERGDALTIEAAGGGGTSFAPVFEAVEQADEQPVVLVYLTDLYGSFPQDAPSYPVIWAVYSPETDVPFGDVVSCQ